MNVFLAKLRGLSTPTKIAIAAVFGILIVIAIVIGSKYGATAAGAGLVGVLGTMFGRRPKPAASGSGDLADANLEQVERDAERSRAETDAAARSRAEIREEEAERAALAAGADDGDDPRRVLDRQSADGRRRRRD